MAWFKRATLLTSATLVVVVAWCGVAAQAAGQDRWGELDPWLGGGTGVCNRDGKDRSLTDANGNGRIEVSELYRFVKDKVSALRNGEQTP